MYAKSIVKAILDTYYRDVNIPELEFDAALLNVQQHVGIILNLFTEVMLKRSEYSEENLIVTEEDEKPEGEQQEEEESKNA